MLFLETIGILLAVLASTSSGDGQVCLVGDASKEDLCDNGNKFCGSKTCKDGFPNCYTVYRKLPEDVNIIPIFGTCWEDDIDNCAIDKCVMEYIADAHIYHCCCKGHLCNQNIIFPKLKTTVSTGIGGDGKENRTTVSLQNTKEEKKSQYYLYYVPASVILSILFAGLALYMVIKRKRRRMDSENLISDFYTTFNTSKQIQTPALMLQILHEGHMGVIWKGTYNQRYVAIKVINSDHSDLWLAEKDIFVNYKLKDENLVNFICAEKRFHENCMQYWIVTEYQENGSLAGYLYNYTLSKDTFFKMVYSLIKGLVYLHSNDNSNGKPMIAHRDLKSGNVLVKKDLSCCICDLGLAIALPEHIKVSHDLCQAGTKRYMAPEMLQGAVTFQQESFLRADMYSIGLLLWELFSRIQIDDTDEVEPYQPPYAEFVNFDPSVDEMLKCVVENKERPNIKREWRELPELNSLVDTMTCCWDDDSDARLTSHCVEHRIKNIIDSLSSEEESDEKSLQQLKDNNVSEESSDSSVVSCHTVLLTKHSSPEST